MFCTGGAKDCDDYILNLEDCTAVCGVLFIPLLESEARTRCQKENSDCAVFGPADRGAADRGH